MAWCSPCSGSRCSTHDTRRAESPARGTAMGGRERRRADLARNGKGARDRSARVTFVASPAGADMEPVATDHAMRSDPGEEEAERAVRFSVLLVCMLVGLMLAPLFGESDTGYTIARI